MQTFVLKYFKINMSEVDNKDDEIDSNEKWRISILLGVAALLIFSPVIFSFSNSILSYVNLHTQDKKGRPTVSGWIIHTAIYIAIVRILMK